jgi:hypothetical protein
VWENELWPPGGFRAHFDSFHPSALRLSIGTFYFGQLGTFHFGATNERDGLTQRPKVIDSRGGLCTPLGHIGTGRSSNLVGSALPGLDHLPSLKLVDLFFLRLPNGLGWLPEDLTVQPS